MTATWHQLPGWFWELLETRGPAEGAELSVRGQKLVVQQGLPRSATLVSARQQQTSDTFGFKWALRDTFEGPAARARMREWLVERYGALETDPWLDEHGPGAVLVDAGCGAALSALELFGARLKRLRYVGVDVSTAVEVASARFAERGIPAGFIQVDLNAIPLAPQSVDLIFSEGVLHHTDSTEKALAALVPLLKKGGRIMFYVYKKKGPIREFTDDHVRQKLQGLPPEKAWELMMPLTKLGKVLGDLDLELDVPEDIELLQIPRGKINLQRFFYWHVFKAFYRPDHTLEELNHINFDWYAPMNAHRQTPEEVRAWCKALSLSIEREIIQEAGITVIAKRS